VTADQPEVFEIAIAPVASDDDVAELRDAIDAYNQETTGFRDGASLSCSLRDDAGGAA
jgi:hypothetical protein